MGIKKKRKYSNAFNITAILPNHPLALNQSKKYNNPEQAASMGQKSQAKKLILAHFDANVYRTTKDRQQAEKQAQIIFANTLSAYDGLTISL